MPAPVYNVTPNATDRISATQAPIQTNFASINTSFNVNHYQIDDATNWGKHLFVQLPEQAVSATTAVNECALYSKQGSGTVTQLFYRPENNGTEVELTYAKPSVTDGYTYLPSGLLIRWGHASVTGVSSVTVATTPYFTTIYNVQISVRNAANTDRSATLRSYTVTPATSFTLTLDGAVRTTDVPATVEFDYLIIGV